MTNMRSSDTKEEIERQKAEEEQKAEAMMQLFFRIRKARGEIDLLCSEPGASYCQHNRTGDKYECECSMYQDGQEDEDIA